MMKTRQIAICGLVAAGCASVPPPPTEVPVEVQEPEERADTVRPDRTLRLGVVVTRSGSPYLEQFGRAVVEGVELAVAEHGDSVVVLLRDDGGRPDRVAAELDSLRTQGAAAVIGPLTAEALESAALARGDAPLLLLSPTASVELVPRPAAYALNSADTRSAEVLAQYAAEHDLAPIGMLVARTESATRQARAFRTAYPYAMDLVEQAIDSTETSLEIPLGALLEAGIRSLYIVTDPRQLRQILPQIEYYGLATVQLLGGEAWTDPELRFVPQRALEGAIVATVLPQEDPATAWNDFVRAYETRHRRSLESVLPALGYDAARLALAAAAAGDPEATANRAATIRDFRGATGILTLEGDSVTRRPFLRRYVNGRLGPLE